MRRFRLLGCCRVKDRRGISAMEFAFVAPVLVILMLGAFDLGNAAYQYIVLNQIVRAGAQYAMTHAGDATGVNSVQSYTEAAATAAWGSPSGVTVAAPSYFCSCDPAGTSRTAPTVCTVSPPGCATPDQFVQVTASRAYQYLLFDVAGPTVSASYVERFQ